MRNSIDVKRALLIFSKVTSAGIRNGEYYEYQGFKAWSGFDEYTCFLQYQTVVMTLMFHGKYKVDFPDEQALEQFEKKLITFKE